MPATMRSLLVKICILFTPNDCSALFESFVDALLDDFARNHSPNIASEMCFATINDHLRALNSSKTAVRLPEPDNAIINEVENTDICADIIDMALNNDQQAVFNAIISVIDAASRKDR